MEKIFPSMCSKPEKFKIIAIIPCWIWAFVLFPMYMPLLGLGLWEQWEISSFLETGYHVVNGIIMLLLMWSYLKEEWFMVTTAVRYYLKHVALTVGLMLGTELMLLGAMSLYGFDINYILEELPVAEMSVSHSPLLLVLVDPVFGTIALSVFAPITVCSLFYCLGFAPVCYHKPWLAYLCIAVITMIPPVVNILWRDEVVSSIFGYIAHLPIHMLACWSYQKTDNVWTPIVSLAGANLLMSLAQIFLFH